MYVRECVDVCVGDCLSECVNDCPWVTVWVGGVGGGECVDGLLVISRCVVGLRMRVWVSLWVCGLVCWRVGDWMDER